VKTFGVEVLLHLFLTRYLVQVIGQLRIPAALSSKISLCYRLNRRPSGPQSLSGGFGVEKCLECIEHLVMCRTCNKGVTDRLVMQPASFIPLMTHCRTSLIVARYNSALKLKKEYNSASTSWPVTGQTYLSFRLTTCFPTLCP